MQRKLRSSRRPISLDGNLQNYDTTQTSMRQPLKLPEYTHGRDNIKIRNEMTPVGQMSWWDGGDKETQ